MGTAKINQKEYLKKYLGHDNDEKKKKKKKYKIGPKKVKIIDDDVDLKNLRPLEDGEFDIFNSTEDAPQIAGIIDERGPINFGDKRRWKIIADDGEGNVAISSSNDQRNPEEISRNKKQYNRSNDDFSPPRKLIKDSKHNHHDSNEKNSDVSQRDREKLSLRKENKHHELSNDDLSPSRVSIRDSKQKPQNFHRDSDIPRQDQRRSSSKRDRRSYVQSDDDLSPPRSQFEHSGRKFHNSNRHCDELQSDRRKLSSHRKEKNHSYSNVHLSPLQGQSRNSNERYHDSNRNFDDSRRNRERSSSKRVDKKQTYNDDDLSPPRVRDRNQEAKYHDSDRNSHHSRSNKLKSSSKRRRNNSLNDDDMSPPRLSMKSTELTHRNSYKGSDSLRNYQDKTSRNRKSRWTDESQHSQSPPIDKRMKKTLDGKAAGLQDAATLREEIAAYKKREDKFFSEMSAEISGVGQAAVLRDRKTGKKRNLEAEAAQKYEEEKVQNEIDAKYAKWGKGLKQVDDQTEKLKQDLYEMSKPLARYADDADLDAQLRAADREGDPMREYLKQKRIKEGKQEPDRPSYQGSYMPNRFGIKPGHRWDGVDRSNGYEKKWFEARNARIAVQEEAYKWSTADM